MKVRTLIAAGLSLSLATLALAQNTTPKSTMPAPKPGEKQPTAPAKDPSQMTQDEMLKMIAEKNPVTEEHHKLAMQLAGEWTVECSFTPAPGAPATKSTGKAWFTAMPGMQTRWVTQKFEGEFLGKKFNGFGLLGYNTTTNKYESVWVDSMANSMMKDEGTKDGSNVLDFKGTYTCCLTGENKTSHSRYTFNGPNSFTYEMFDQDENGKEFKSFTITYTRIAPPKDLPAGTTKPDTKKDVSK